MATSKVDRSKYGPGLGEVVLGAALSLALGAVLAMGVLVARPAQLVREMPKERAVGTVYYLEGSRNMDSGKQWLRKRQLFSEGSSVSLNEDELNLWISSSTGAAPVKPAGTPKLAQGAPSTALLELGTPNFRINDSSLQIASQCMLNLDWLGIRLPVVVQVVGHFVKHGDTFSLAMDQLYVGSCALHKVPVVGALVYDELRAKEKAPSDLAAAWKKLTGVSIEAKTLKLTMP